jgi:ribose-phosphate pyrophosphokinase
MPNKTNSLAKSFVDDYVILTGRANPELARKVGKLLKKEVHDTITIFSDGETRIRIPVNLRRRQVIIIQPTAPPVNDHVIELIFLIDAAKRASASEIIAVVPYFGYARQDRKEMPRVPISSSVVSRLIENTGANAILTIDIHSEQQEGSINGPWDNLYGSYTLIPELKKRKLKHLVVASPDKGAVNRATGYARLLSAEGIAIVYKERDINIQNSSETLTMIGDVEGKDVLLVDDMIDTGGTIVNAANLLKKKGAKSIRVATTHGVFSGPALERINNSAIEEVLVTDTILQKDEVKNNKKFTIISVAPLLAEAIKRIRSGESISRDLIL